MDSKYALIVEGLSCSGILHDISFSVPSAAVYGILGPNGAGKTTLFKSLLGLHQKGKVSFKRRFLQGTVGYLPELLSFPEHLTVSQLFRLARSVSPAAGDFMKLCEDLLPIPVSSTRIVASCSKGEQRIIGFHLSLMSGPKVLLLDEPTDGLDAKARIQMRKVLDELSQKGVSIVIASHVLTELELVAKQGLILVDGRVASFYPDDQGLDRTRYIVTFRHDGSLLANRHELISASRCLGHGRYELLTEDRTKFLEAVSLLTEKGQLLRVECAGASLEELFMRYCCD